MKLELRLLDIVSKIQDCNLKKGGFVARSDRIITVTDDE
jgi:hypothetical protein